MFRKLPLSPSSSPARTLRPVLTSAIAPAHSSAVPMTTLPSPLPMISGQPAIKGLCSPPRSLPNVTNLMDLSSKSSGLPTGTEVPTYAAIMSPRRRSLPAANLRPVSPARASSSTVPSAPDVPRSDRPSHSAFSANRSSPELSDVDLPQQGKNSLSTFSAQRSTNFSARVDPVTRECGVILPILDKSLTLDQILPALAAGAQIPPEQFRYASAVNGSFRIYFRHKSFAQQAILHGFDIQDQHVRLRPLIGNDVRVILSNVDPEIPHAQIRALMLRYGQVQGPIRNLRAATRLSAFSHLLGFRRQLFMSFEDDVALAALPQRLSTNVNGVSYTFYVQADQPCDVCGAFSHLPSGCPQRVERANLDTREGPMPRTATVSQSSSADAGRHDPSPSVPAPAPVSLESGNTVPPPLPLSTVQKMDVSSLPSTGLLPSAPGGGSAGLLPLVGVPVRASFPTAPVADAGEAACCPAPPDVPHNIHERPLASCQDFDNVVKKMRTALPCATVPSVGLRPPEVLMDTSPNPAVPSDNSSVSAVSPDADPPCEESEDVKDRSAFFKPYITGPLDRAALTQFLLVVKGTPKPLKIVSQYTNDIGGLVAQLRSIGKRLRKDKSRSADASRISHLADRISGDHDALL